MRTHAEHKFVKGSPRTSECPRVLLSGCGAVAQNYYAGALRQLDRNGGAKLAGVFDPDVGATRLLLSTSPSSIAVETFEQLLGIEGEIAIIASPPAFHAEQCMKALNAGLHVFCEEPLATAVGDANQIVATAQGLGLSVGVGLVRRQFPAARSIKAVLQSGLIGRIKSVDCFEGDMSHWPVSSPRYFDPILSGGGVLQDIGTHCLDLLSWWFGPPDGVDYLDDCMGGVEANCAVRLRYSEFEANIRLSRDCRLANRYSIQGEDGWLDWDIQETDVLEVGLAHSRTKGKWVLSEASGIRKDFDACFTSQIEGFLAAIKAGQPPPVPAAAGRDVLETIEQCYRRRRLMDMPWMTEAERECALALAGNP